MVQMFVCIALTLIAAPAHAMPVSEGILPRPWAIAWFAAATPFVALGMQQLHNTLRNKNLPAKPLLGLMAAMVFIISCIPVSVPTAGTSSHLCGTGIAAILLGPWISALIASATLLLQTVFLSHGAFSSWGAATFSMGVIGSIAGYLTFKGLRVMGLPLGLAAFLAGLQANWATYLAVSVQLAAGTRGNEPFLPLLEKIMLAFVPTQLPLGILEGVITAGLLLILFRKRPDILVKLRVVEPGELEKKKTTKPAKGSGRKLKNT